MPSHKQSAGSWSMNGTLSCFDMKHHHTQPRPTLSLSLSLSLIYNIICILMPSSRTDIIMLRSHIDIRIETERAVSCIHRVALSKFFTMDKNVGVMAQSTLSNRGSLIGFLQRKASWKLVYNSLISSVTCNGRVGSCNCCHCHLSPKDCLFALMGKNCETND